MLPKKSIAKNKSDNLAEKLKTNSITIKIEDFLKFSGDYKFLQRVLNFIPAPISLKNSQGEYLVINKAMEELFGYRKGQVVGKNISMSNQQNYIEEMLSADKEAVKIGSSNTFETAYQKQDGKWINLMVSKHRVNLSDNKEPGILTLATDITRTKKAEDLINIQYTIDYLETLNKGLKRTLESILEQLFKLHWVDAGGIYIYNPNNKKLNLICHKGLSKNFVKDVNIYDKNSVQFNILLKKETIYVKTGDLPEHSRNRNEKEGILFTAIIPLVSSATNYLVGSLNVASKKFEEISDEDKRGVESIGRRIVNLILYAQSQEKLTEARIILENTVEEKTRELKNKIDQLTIKEHEIRLSEKKYRKLQENLPIGIFTTTPEGKLLYVNKTASKIFGYDTTEEMLEVPIIDLYNSKEERSEFVQALVKEGKLINKEVKLVRKDKTVFWAKLRAQAAYDKQGKPFLFDGIIEDISEIKDTRFRLEEANKTILSINKNLEKKIQNALGKQEKQNALLIQKSKLESLGELLAGIAHEINQPLGVMALTFENLKLKINSQKLTPEYLETKFQSIDENMKRIRDIIDHIRTFSRDQESFVLDKVNVNKVIRKTLSMIGVQYSNHNINIKLDLKENIGFTVGSNLKLEQVILNLLSNSKYALEEKGTFVNENLFSKEILIKTDATASKIILMVEDNGIGIKASHLSRIFDPFFTTKPEGFGTGLGLSIVYGLVKDMRGEILVNSMENKFTKFKITFPRFPENN
jgi:PAS domain S-box-containing protein